MIANKMTDHRCLNDVDIHDIYMNYSSGNVDVQAIKTCFYVVY